MRKNHLTMKTLNAGLLIADPDEYVHIPERFGNKLTENNILGLIGHKVTIKGKDRDIDLYMLCSGVGKVNAAIGASFLASRCDIVLNAGLSGGFKDTFKNGTVVGSSYVEHDFDLTVLGYKLGQKVRNQSSVYYADGELLDSFLASCPGALAGCFVTGDSFVADKAKHDLLLKEFDPVACDMESAAVAAAAYTFGKKFLSIRTVSDGADDSSAENYSDSLGGIAQSGWLEPIINWLKNY